MSAHRSRLIGRLAAAALLLATAPAGAALLNYEYGAAQGQLGEVGMLAERLSKQNVLYQLHLADQHKLDTLETAQKISDALESLRKGDPLLGIPRPPTAEIQDQLSRIETAWLPLRDMALASPYEYLRRSGQFLTPRARSADPLLLLYFDRVASEMIEAVDRARELYNAQCKEDGYSHCDLTARQGLAERLSERIVKQAVLLFTGIGPTSTQEALLETRDAYEKIGSYPENERLMEKAVAPVRGGEGAHVSQLLRDVNDYWKRLRQEIDLVIADRAEEANIARLVRLQELLVVDIQRLTVAVVRFARIEEGGLVGVSTGE